MVKISSPVQDLGVDGLILQVGEVHLLPDLLEHGLAAECRQVRESPPQPAILTSKMIKLI